MLRKEVTIISKKLTTDEFICKYKELNKPVEIIGEYINCKTKIECLCLICNKKFWATPDSLMQGKIHKPCAMKIFGEKKTSNTDEFKSKLYKINKDVEVIGEYINAITKIKMKCKKCNKTFEMTPNCLLNGQSCPRCQHRSYKKTTDEFKEEVSKLTNGEYSLVGKYIDCKNKVSILHHKCNRIFNVAPANFISGNRCPFCRKSKGETKIENFLISKNISYISQKNLKILKVLAVGIYLMIFLFLNTMY